MPRIWGMASCRCGLRRKLLYLPRKSVLDERNRGKLNVKILSLIKIIVKLKLNVTISFISQPLYLQYAMSFNTNPNKWMLVNFDCSLMWVRDRFKLTQALVVDPLYLQHSYSESAIDYRVNNLWKPHKILSFVISNINSNKGYLLHRFWLFLSFIFSIGEYL